MTSQYPVHELANVLPDMRPEEYQRLKASIQKHGQKRPIALWRGTILDGRHRLKACTELGVEPRFGQLPDDTDPTAYIIIANIEHRHMNESQIGLVLARLNKWSANRGGDRRSQEFQAQPPPNREDAAEQAGISVRTLGRAAAVVDKGTPALVDAVRDGAVSLHDAARVAQRPEAEQNSAVSAVLSGQAKTATSALAPPKPPQTAPAPSNPPPPPPTPKASILTPEARIADLESEVRYLREQVDADASQDAEFTRLRGEIATLQSSVNTWQSRYNELEAENRKLRRRLGE